MSDMVSNQHCSSHCYCDHFMEQTQ